MEEGNEVKFHALAFSEVRSNDFWNKDNGKRTFLQQACYEECACIVEDLINLGADLNK